MDDVQYTLVCAAVCIVFAALTMVVVVMAQ